MSDRSPLRPELPERLGLYELHEEIGRGGMAVVHRAHQPSVGRDVAVKLVTTGLAASAEAARRFQREARLVARLEHPHVLPVYDFDGTHDPPYLTMRLVKGGTLKELAASEALPFGEVVRLLRQVAGALDYAHRQGIVHRDVKPSNILLDGERNAFVADFGLARAADGAQLTSQGSVLGTADYMAPEQASGADEVGPPGDRYALGVVAFELLTGRVPFKAASPMGVLIQHVQAAVPSACGFNDQLPAAVDEVLARAMAKDPEARPASGQAFVDALASALGQSAPGESGGVAMIGDSATAATMIEPHAGSALRRSRPRTVTVLAIDATDYAAEIECQRGIESVGPALGALAEVVIGEIRARGGRCLPPLGPLHVALWGLETTAEDDAAQAVEAARAIGRSLSPVASEASEQVAVGLGIVTGPVIVDGASMPGPGATLGRAIRLAGLPSGQPRIARATARRVRGQFELVADGEAFRVVGDIDGPSSRGALPDAPLIGRSAELESLRNAWLDAIEDGEPQARTVIGEAGLGKTRLLAELCEWLEGRDEPSAQLVGRGVGPRPYGLVRDLVCRLAGVRDSDDMEAARETLTDRLRDVGRDGAALVGQLIGVDFAEATGVRAVGGSPEQLARAAVAALRRLLGKLARRRPLLIAIDDLHRADDVSLDVLGEALADAELGPVLLVGLARPELRELRPGWGDSPVHEWVELRPLDRRGARELVRRLLHRVDPLPRELRDLVVERAAGNPYYVEELVEALIDERVVHAEGERWDVDLERARRMSLPPTLADLLGARLDGLLVPERLVLQRAAIFEDVCWSGALAALDAGDQARVDDPEAVLESLVEQGYLVRCDRSTFDGQVELRLASPLLREAVLAGVLESRRTRYHRMAADWLREAAGERAVEVVETIAWHRRAGGECGRAAFGYLEAARRAQACNALDRALALLEDVIGLAEEASADAEPDPRLPTTRADALAERGALRMYRGDYDGARTDLEAALASARELGDRPIVARTLGYLGNLSRRTADYGRGREQLTEAIELAQALGEAQTEALLLRQLGIVEGYLGDPEAARRRIEDSLARCQALGLDSAAGDAVNSLGNLARNAGQLDEALAFYEQAVQIARGLGDLDGECLARANAGAVQIQLGHTAVGREMATEALAIAERLDHRYARVGILNIIADGALRDGDTDEASARATAALAGARALGSAAQTVDTLVTFARLHQARGEDQAAAELGATLLSQPALTTVSRGQVEALLAELTVTATPTGASLDALAARYSG